MSSLLRPVGHLPASVYWFRRGLVLVVLLGLLWLMVRLIGGDDPQNTAAGGPAQGQESPPPTGINASADPSSSPPSGRPTDEKATPERPRDVKCTGSDVRISVVPANRMIRSGNALTFTIRFSAVTAECKAQVDPELLTVTVTSGTDLIWTTSQCEQVIQRTTLVVAKGKDPSSVVPWDGRRSGPGCLPGQAKAKPGTYVVTAEYDGRASTAQAFQVV